MKARGRKHHRVQAADGSLARSLARLVVVEDPVRRSWRQVVAPLLWGVSSLPGYHVRAHLQVVRHLWLVIQLHAASKLFQELVPLLLVALVAGGNQIVPLGSSPPARGDHVVKRQVLRAAAVLALVAVPGVHVFPRQGDALVERALELLHVELHPNHRGEVVVVPRAPDERVVVLEDVHFVKAVQHDCPRPRNGVERPVGDVQDQSPKLTELGVRYGAQVLSEVRVNTERLRERVGWRRQALGGKHESLRGVLPQLRTKRPSLRGFGPIHA
mmetsp:Transcript_10385/g.21283  ORF Transcript_10385/g.21283 Transcript_10385/m.21283 type:complete len:271 (-) Transcript_10385:436-1248(-)